MSCVVRVIVTGEADWPSITSRAGSDSCDTATGPLPLGQPPEDGGGVGVVVVVPPRGWTSALAAPQFVIDAPGGGGKVPLLPEYVEEINDDEVIFRNFQGQRFTYRQPRPYDGSGTPDIVPIEIAAKKQRTAAKKVGRPRRRKAAGE